MNDRSRLKDTMRQFHAVVFDMDGLLLDTERIALSAFVETCEHFGIGEQTALFMRCIGTNRASGEDVLKQGLEDKVDHIRFGYVWDTKYLERTSSTPIPLKDGATEFLEQLASLSMPLAVATSTDTVRATQKLRDAGILDKFSAVVGGDQAPNSKPHPDIYLRAAAILGVRASKCLALEDSENGVRSAVSAGMTVVQIPDLVQPTPGLRALGHVVLGTLRDVSKHEFALR
jgi:HAD superfamily hydrolase (TIGR01509 family)